MSLSRTALILALLLAIVAGCAPGNERWNRETGRPASFWAGLWHGLIIVVTFVVSLFSRTVGIYEVNNTGWPYNLGFLLGAMMALGGGARSACHQKRHSHDWERIGRSIGDGIRAGLSSWRSEQNTAPSEPDWDELGRRIEQRVREELRDLLE
ncbi:MAG: hypothetical protein ABIK86_00955 [candidate division WOR-3 bacterium]